MWRPFRLRCHPSVYACAPTTSYSVQCFSCGVKGGFKTYGVKPPCVLTKPLPAYLPFFFVFFAHLMHHATFLFVDFVHRQSNVTTIPVSMFSHYNSHACPTQLPS